MRDSKTTRMKTNFISLHEIGMTKAMIRKQIDRFVDEVSVNDERMEQVMDALTLLNQHEDKYTATEAETLLSWYITSHDECVDENQEGFTGLEVYRVKKKIERYDKAMDTIECIRGEWMSGVHGYSLEHDTYESSVRI